MDNSVFISYKSEDAASINRIENMLRRFGVSVTRDLRDLEYNMDIHDFMNRINDHDKIIVFVSDLYFRSLNCMYEASQALARPHIFLFVMKDGTSISDPDDKRNYINFWESEYEKIKTDPASSERMISDAKLACDSIGAFIDLINSRKRMRERDVDYTSLLNALEFTPKYPDIINSDVLRWIEKYENNNLADIYFLISDLMRSSRIECSPYPDIPDDEVSYFFEKIEFRSNQNGIDLMFRVQDINSGEESGFSYQRVVQIEENSMRSEKHAKYYFHCENPGRKQRYMELSRRKDKLGLSREEDEVLIEGYTFIYRMIICFDSKDSK